MKKLIYKNFLRRHYPKNSFSLGAPLYIRSIKKLVTLGRASICYHKKQITNVIVQKGSFSVSSLLKYFTKQSIDADIIITGSIVTKLLNFNFGTLYDLLIRSICFF